MTFETWLRSDLTKPLKMETLPGVFFTADNAANIIGVEVYDSGAAADLSGSCVGYVVRADGGTVIITGTISGNRASITLPTSAYVMEGPIDIVIKVVNGSVKTTVGACHGYVARSTTDAIIDPGHIIPSIEELLAQIEACEQATEAANAAAANADRKAAGADTAAAGANAAAGNANTAKDRANAAASALENMDATASGLAEKTPPTVEVSTVDGHYRIALGIPKGDKGNTGDTGAAAAITGTATAYQNSTSGTTIPTGTWLDTQPVTPQGQFLWTRTILTWNNGQATTMYSVSRMGVDGRGSVSSVNGVSPDANGNVVLPIDSTIAIVVTGPSIRQNIAKGQYVIWQGTLYTAKDDLVSGNIPSTSNLQAVQNGGLNALKSSVDTLSDKMTAVLISNAGAHNSIYRGEYLGASVTPAQYTAIANGTFDDLYLGDYWTIGDHNWVICDFDYYIRCGSWNDITRHHLVMMPSDGMNIPEGTVLYGTSDKLTLLDGEHELGKNWNAASSTAGGYKYSRMRTVIMKAANTIVINAFGSDHVLPFDELYPDPVAATDSGLASSWTTFMYDDQSKVLSKSICDLCNETMVYGQQVWGRGSAYTNVGYEIGYDKFQLAIFAIRRDFANIRRDWWLRSVSSDTDVACADYDGSAWHNQSGVPNAVRPRFLLVGGE